MQDNPIATPNDSTPSPPIRLEFLDGLRGLAALYVVCFHFTTSRFTVDAGEKRIPLPFPLQAIASTMQHGHYAVAIFIVLSGYSLMLPVARSKDGNLRGGWTGYLWRRARRILPPYYAALLLSLTCLAVGKHWSDVSWGALWSHLLLLHNLHPIWNMAINIPLWSVATEWDIYFLFPLLLLPLWRKWGSAAAIGAGFLVGWTPHFCFPATWNLDWACPWYLGLFGLGMGAATVHFSPASRLARQSTRSWFSLGAGFFAMFFFVSVAQPLWMEQQRWILDPLVGLCAACAILACATTTIQEKERHFLLRILDHPWSLRLGAFSYSLYLTHILVKWGIYALADRFPFSPTALQWVLLLVGIPGSLLVAWLFYLLVERRFLSTRSATRQREREASLHSLSRLPTQGRGSF